MNEWNDRVARAKNTSIIAYLRGRGFHPVKRSGKYVMYKSLWREETKASLAVINDRTWEDFGESGTDNHGDLIDLVKRYDNTTMKQAVDIILEGRGALIEPLPEPVIVRPPAVEIVQERALKEPSLTSYITSRGISLDLAVLYLTELHVRFMNAPNPNKVVPVIGFKNDMGGYELRSERIKHSKAPKHYTTIKYAHSDLKAVCVLFEGFFSFLSALTVYKTDAFIGDMIILNSLSFIPMAVPFLKDYDAVTSCLDNDSAGNKATNALKNAGINLYDAREWYRDYNDWNDYLLNRKT